MTKSKSKLTYMCSLGGYYFYIKTPTKDLTALTPSNFVSKDVRDYKKLLEENSELLLSEYAIGMENEEDYFDVYYS